MTIMTDLHTGPAGRSYADPYDAGIGERPKALCATLATLAVLMIGLLALLVVLMPMVALAIAVPVMAFVGRYTFRRVRRTHAG